MKKTSSYKVVLIVIGIIIAVTLGENSVHV